MIKRSILVAVLFLGGSISTAYSEDKTLELWSGSLMDIGVSGNTVTGQVFGPTINSPGLGLLLAPSLELTFSPSIGTILGNVYFAPRVGFIYGFSDLRDSTFYFGAEAGFLTLGGGAGVMGQGRFGAKIKIYENVLYAPELRIGVAQIVPSNSNSFTSVSLIPLQVSIFLF